MFIYMICCNKYAHCTVTHWYAYNTHVITKKDNAKFVLDFLAHCKYEIDSRKPDIVVMEKESKVFWIIHYSTMRIENEKMSIDVRGFLGELSNCSQ